MSRSTIQNFRGARALVVHPDDANRAVLATVLRRLGLLVALVEPGGSGPVPGIEACDVIFFDADQGLGSVFSDSEPPDVPYIALIGVEAPGRLARVVRQRCAAYLMKPIRASGIFTALFIAMNEFAERGREARIRAAMTDRLACRRIINKAVLQVMTDTGLDDDEAYRLLRHESMRRRVTIETVARERLGGTLAKRAGPLSA